MDGYGIPDWVGPAWCQACGRLPQTMDELLTWGQQQGYYDPSKGWVGQTTAAESDAGGGKAPKAWPSFGWQIAGLIALAIIAFVPRR